MLIELPKLAWFWTENTAPRKGQCFPEALSDENAEARAQEDGVALDVERTTELHLRARMACVTSPDRLSFPGPLAWSLTEAVEAKLV